MNKWMNVHDTQCSPEHFRQYTLAPPRQSSLLRCCPIAALVKQDVKYCCLNSWYVMQLILYITGPFFQYTFMHSPKDFLIYAMVKRHGKTLQPCWRTTPNVLEWGHHIQLFRLQKDNALWNQHRPIHFVSFFKLLYYWTFLKYISSYLQKVQLPHRVTRNCLTRWDTTAIHISSNTIELCIISKKTVDKIYATFL